VNKKNEISPDRNLNIEKEKIIPILEEKVTVGKRRRVTGSVRITKKVHEREELVDEPLVKEIVSIERIPVNRFVENAVSIRQEKGITIVPIMEEVIVMEKKLFLKEELHIRKITETFREPRKVLVRSEEAVIEHLEPKE
jgi:uncharacterized protein (TIGR02271 family)